MKITTAGLLLRYLEGEGVEYIFGVPGTALVPLYDAINKQDAIKPILSKHEEGAAFMADGYARVSGKIGVCYATSGPGTTNLATGVANAYMDDVPLLVITGQVPTSIYGKGTFQDSTKEGVDSVAMFDPITKYSEMIMSRYKMPETLREAFRIAFSGKKGPVHLSYPKDIMEAEIEDTLLPPRRYRVKSAYFDRKLVIDATEKLVNAKKPAMLVGSGVIASDAASEVLELAEMLNIPVATTPKAKGAFPEDHDLSLGVLGFSGSPVAEEYLMGDVDVLLVVGASLNQLTTFSWDPKLEPSDSLIHINIDPSEIDKNYVADIGLVGDCQAVINEISFRILRELQKHDPKEERPIEDIIKFKDSVGMVVDEEEMFSESVPIKPQALMREIQECLPDDAIVFVDTGNHICWAIHYMQFKKPNFISAFGMLSMGYATAAAIGGKLAAPDRPVVAIVGDGCFLMNGMEIATAVNYDIPVVWIVQNNSKLGLVHDLQRFSLGDKTVSTTFKEVNFARVAEGLGAKGYRIKRPGELSEILPEAIERAVPTVIDVIIDPNEVPPIDRWVKGVGELRARLDYL
uniref:3D-(3,5/4)-trihydroxycyclohexane-1,2-dione hydrolase n=1 Tax=Candidatus Methanophaga sp. ANME-1 ERB7 TaxID=2759913 RepID=A0A7G9Z5S8_9EURY|nr:3D-(3,5/4)-trihydroxycyclohexane-1,2-dione hydrolase [Methanosarcinales archaeon ANME-1 ERB7]